MYLLTMFDLPIKTKHRRRIDRLYRKKLLELGFLRIQFSVYIKYVESETQANTLKKAIRLALPKMAEVRTVHLTDSQYQKMETFSNNSKQTENVPPIEDFIVFKTPVAPSHTATERYILDFSENLCKLRVRPYCQIGPIAGQVLR